MVAKRPGAAFELINRACSGAPFAISHTAVGSAYCKGLKAAAI